MADGESCEGASRGAICLNSSNYELYQAPYSDQELTYEALVNLGAAYRAQGWIGEAEDMFRVGIAHEPFSASYTAIDAGSCQTG